LIIEFSKVVLLGNVSWVDAAVCIQAMMTMIAMVAMIASVVAMAVAGLTAMATEAGIGLEWGLAELVAHTLST